MKSEMTPIRQALSLLLLIILLAGCQPKAAPQPTELLSTVQIPVTGSTATALVQTEAVNPAVVAVNQEIQQGKIKIDEVVSQGPGWLVIYNQEGGGLGRVIGYIAVKGGSTKNLTVNVDETIATDVIYAMVHMDAGKIGAFEFPGPDVPVVVDGKTVWSQLSTSSSNSELSSGAPQESTLPAASGTAGGTPSPQVAPGLNVVDQEPANETVMVDFLASSGPGWLAIYNQKDREPGEIIGFTPIQPGENRDVVVKIDPAKVTETLYAVLHTDEGQTGVPEFSGPDVPATNGTQIIMSSFKTIPQAASEEQPSASSAPVVEVVDQEIIDGKVTIARVVSDSPGWLVIYTWVFGHPGEGIGVSTVKAGENRDVTVTINGEKATQTLVAILHKDAGAGGVYESPGPDKPVVQTTFQTSAVQSAGASPTSTSESATSSGYAGGSASGETPSGDATAAGSSASDMPSVVIEDQVIRSGTVRAISVNMQVPGFLTIHNQNSAGAYGPIIGWTAVNQGETQNVLVKIDLMKATETLYGMLHVDNDPAGVLEFPGPDEPVMVEGSMAAQPFKITGGLAGSGVVVGATSGDSPHLVDGSGMSLYTFLNDALGVSNCTGDCLKNWLPLTVTGRLASGPGVIESKLSIIFLPDGTRQVTYNGLPLYYFARDQKPGDVLGEGIGDLWFLARP